MNTRLSIFGVMILGSFAFAATTTVMFPAGDAGPDGAPQDSGGSNDGSFTDVSCGDFFVDACSGMGSGGCGGFGGGAGTGGQGGGAAIALLASGPTTSVTMTNGGLFTGNGGTGGQGGNGQPGALGDAGAVGPQLKCSDTLCNCTATSIILGGIGGPGFQGGSGGQGGGGAGGPTYFYVLLGGATLDASPASINASTHLGDGGQGGLPNGPNGVQAQHFP